MSPTVEPVEALEPGERVEAAAHRGAATGFFPGFDGLRAIAALMVLATHVWLASSADKPLATSDSFFAPFFAQLDIGVPVFFVISGFLLYRPFVAARFGDRTMQSPGGFWKRRVLRIFPAYWVCLIVVSAFMYDGPLPIDSVKSFLTHFFLLQIYTEDRVVGGPVQQSWTLAVELAFYAFLPFYAYWIRKVRTTRISALTVELVGIAGLYLVSVGYRLALLAADLTPSEFSHYRLFLPGFLDQLAMGMGLAVLSAWLAGRRSTVTAPSWFAGASWAAALACFVVVSKGLGLPLGPTDPRTGSEFLLEQLFRGLFALFLVLPAVFLARRHGIIHRFLSARVMVFLGLVSYGIYLWHEAWIDTFLKVFDYSLFAAPAGSLALWTLALTIPTAALSYWVVERPALSLKGRRLVPSRVQSLGERCFARWGTFEWALLTIVLAGFILRLAYIWYERRPHFETFGVIGDAGFYHGGANVLADGLGFINPFQYYQRGILVEEASHPPLYILWLTVPSLLGFRGTNAHMLWTLPIGTATIAFAGYAGKEMAGRRVGIIAAALVAFYPNVWSHDGFLTSETMSLSTATFTVWMAYRYWRAPSMRRALVLGLAVGLAVAARTEMTMLIPFMVIPLVLATRDTSWVERWKRLVATGAMVLVVIGPWLVFNLTRFEHPVLVGTGFGITLASANCDNTYYGDDIGYWSMPCTLEIDAKYDGLYDIDQTVAESTYRREALEYISDNKGRFAYVTLVRWARYTGLWDLTHGFDQVHKDIDPEGREPWVAWTSVGWWFVIFPSAIAGAVLLRRRRIPVYIVAAPIVATIVTTTMTFYQNRYRASGETAFCLLAAVTFAAILRRRDPRPEPGPGAEPIPEPRPDPTPELV